MTRTAKTKTATPTPTTAKPPPAARAAAPKKQASAPPPPPAPAASASAPTQPSPPEAAASVPARPAGKLGVLVDLLRRPQGASVHDLAEATGWQIHSVRGAMAGSLRHRGFVIVSDKPAELRIYRIEPPPKPAAKRGRAKAN